MSSTRWPTPTDPIRYGLIGSGMMGREHLHNIAAIDGATVVAISDPDEGSRQAGMADSPPGVAVFEDHRDLLAAGSVDAVVIASPNFTHVDVLADVVATGVHVLVEKPLCTTIADCQRILDLAKGAPQVIQVGLEYRFMPPVARLIDEVRAGIIGTPRMVSIREHRFPFLDKVGHWNRFSVNTGGTLVEKCCHFFDLMDLIIGERPNKVMASGGHDVNHLDELYDGRRPDMLDNAFVIVEYPSGARACLDLCMFAEATHNQEEISVVGDEGKLEALIPEGVVRRGLRAKHQIGDVEIEPVSTDHVAFEGLHHGSSYLQHLEFLAAIGSGNPPPVSLTDGLWSVAVGQAAHLSIAEGRPVAMIEVLG
ncbi:MAG: Gfo/Idh/MocA family oxidoreductase [Actinomycetia bacterium]|nr:Gfo/Idh/MocA family oxidoreductase [Actinomycetes bacterium]MCP5033350.1 Gfo/Idh/MocA family oxidoreductase [Actinomycetes bacterium]